MAATRGSEAAGPPRHEFAEVRPARLRLRHYLLIASFIVIVVVPTSLTAILSWSFAGSLRQVTASVTVQEYSLGALGPTDSGSLLKSALKGSGAEETAIVRQLVHSEDFYRTICDRLDLTRIWPPDRLVPYLPMRYDPAAPVEEGYEFWRNMVVVHLGSRDRIIRISVSAFDQATAEELLFTIRAEAERRLNLARTMTLSAAREEAVDRVEELRARNADDREKLTRFRLEHQTIDPAVQGLMLAEYRSILRGLRAQEEIRLNEAEASVARGEGLARRPVDRIAAIDTYLNDPAASEGRITPADEVTAQIAAYRPVLMDTLLSGMSLRMAEASILHYDRELETTKVFLSSVTGGSMASISLFPQFWPSLLVVLSGTFVLWTSILLIFYGIRDRK
ncbi:MAG: hypothetical protein ACK5LJ_18575 [Paracoccus sp. (in: a-proteobacteria)]